MIFQERLKSLRIKKGLTQEQLANELNIPPTTIRRLETVDSLPRRERLELIAQYFEVSIDYLLGRTDDPEPYAVTAEDLAKGRKAKIPGYLEREESTEITERELLLEELEQYGNLAFEGGGEDLTDEELREIVQAMRDAAENAAKNTLNLINRFKK